MSEPERDQTRRPVHRRRFVILLLFCLVGGTLVAYAPITANDFVNFDDDSYITRNRVIQSGLTGEAMRWALTAREAANWHPLTWWSLELDGTVYGLAPGGFHLSNVLWHTASVGLLFGLLYRLTGALACSAWVAALFGVHPLHVESVAWAAERKDVLSGCFLLLSLWAYARYVAHPGLGRYGGVAAALTLGLMAKPMLVTTPALLLLLDFWPLKRWQAAARDSLAQVASTADSLNRGPSRRWAHLVREKIPLFALSGVSAAITLWVQQGARATIARVPFGFRLLNGAEAYLLYLKSAFWPVNLGVFYPLGYAHWGWQFGILAAAILLLATFGALLQCKRRPYLLVGWLWYLGMLLPVIGLIQVGGQALADRYTYLPLIGIFIMVGWSLRELTENRFRRATLASTGIALLCACVLMSRQQVRYWRDSTTLWTHAIEVTGVNAVAACNLGEALIWQERWSEAQHWLSEAALLDPTNANSRYNLGVVADRLGDRNQARVHYRTVLQLDSNYADAHGALGRLDADQNDWEGAVYHYRQMVQLRPGDAGAHDRLAWALMQSGDTASAVRHYREALRLEPTLRDARTNLQALERADLKER